MTRKRLRVAVLGGGPSSEAAVSRVSAQAVCDALQQGGHEATLLELDANLARRLVQATYDVVFPALHGPLGEDGCVQGLLEVLGLPYVGSAVLASALAASKPHAKAQFRRACLPIAEEYIVQAGADVAESAAELRACLGPAVVVKPASGGSAIGVTRVHAHDDLQTLIAAIHAAFALDHSVMVERFVVGAEVTCGVLENGAGIAEALPPTLISAKARDWYDFQSRYAKGGSEHHCPAPFPRALSERIQSVAIDAHRALGARDLSRVDFVVSEHDAERPVTLLEVNTLPGMTRTSLFPEAAAVAGIPFIELCDRLVQRACARPLRTPPEVMQMPG